MSDKKMGSQPPENEKETKDQIEITIPENFRSVISDFISDLSLTFPEYSYLWLKWGSPDLPDSELEFLFHYLTDIFPQRFFDILYQNEDIFKPSSDLNTCFLPNVDFKLLFNCDNLSENTHKAIWKYLQLILFTVINSVKNKANFGDAMNMFSGIDENELQEKLQETVNGISSFFSNMNESTDDATENVEQDEGSPENIDAEDFAKQAEKIFEKMPNIPGMPNMDEFKKTFDFKNMSKNMPNPEEIHQHLKGLFDGKIGQLAKEMAEEITDDITGLLGEETGDIRTTQDVLKKLMKDPSKMMNLIKSVGSKLNNKMKSGEISQEELMKEASELVGKMKGMGGADEFSDMFKNIAKQMGGLGGLGGMAGMGKNVRVDTNAMNNAMKKMTMREKMKERIEKKRQMAMAQAAINAAKQPGYSLQQTNDKEYVFKTGETQEKSSARPIQTDADIDALVAEIGSINNVVKTNPSKKKKKGKK